MVRHSQVVAGSLAGPSARSGRVRLVALVALVACSAACGPALSPPTVKGPGPDYLEPTPAALDALDASAVPAPAPAPAPGADAGPS